MTTPNAAGAADLKTYDVPDPPKPKGWKARCLLAGLLGLLVAAGVDRALKLPHLFWVAEHHTNRWDSERLGYVQEYVLSELNETYEPATLASYAVGVEDLKIRGYMHRALAATKDPVHLDAMLAYMRSGSHSYMSDTTYREVADSMISVDKGQAAAKLVGAYEEPGDGSDGSSFAVTLYGVLTEKFTPAELAPHVVKLKDETKRGHFHAALATTKDPAHIDAILAYAKTVLTTDSDDRPAEWAPIVASLGAFGPVASKKLEACLQQTDSRTLVSLAAEAMRTSDLSFLVKRAQERLEEYDQAVPQLAEDFQLIQEVDAGETPANVTAERVAAARANLADADAKAFMIFEMLRAMEPVRDDQGVDFCIVRGLSTFNSRIAEWSVMRCKERFNANKLVDTLFSYMAQKTQFKVSEVDVYEGLIKEMGAAGARRVAQNMERLLGQAKNDTSKVFWLYKKMGFAILQELGEPDAIDTLIKYSRDTESWELTTTTTDENGRRTRTKEERKFADDVKNAIKAIEARAQGGN